VVSRADAPMKGTGMSLHEDNQTVVMERRDVVGHVPGPGPPRR
jgi:hypothetical protein